MTIYEELTLRQKKILEKVKVNGPAAMLLDGLLDVFLENRVNPEVGLDNMVVTGRPLPDLVNMAEKLKSAGLTPSAHGPFLDLSAGAVDQDVLNISLKRYTQALDRAALFSAEHVVFHPCYEDVRYRTYREKWMEISISTWREVNRRARERGLRIVLENTYEYGPEDLKPLFEELAPAGVGFCFDIGHATAFGRAPVSEWVDVMAPYIRACHLHDNNGDFDDHLAIGRGGIDFKAFFDQLVGNGVKPDVVTLEPHEKSQLLPSIQALSELWPWELDVD